MLIGYIFICVLFSVFTYGFIDLNLHITTSPLFLALQKPLEMLVYQMRPVAAGIFLSFLVLLFIWYMWFLRSGEKIVSVKKVFLLLSLVAIIFVFSFPAFSYDIFNYITTAKVTFFHNENPYLVMPIEITGEPYLAFTRAANKVALYGPVWILLTAIPHYLGSGAIWQTIIAFKLINALFYLIASYLIYKMTKQVKSVLFFAANPLVLIEVLISTHNDISMMVLVLTGILLWFSKGIGNKIMGVFAMLASTLIKGATVVLLPLLFVKSLTKEQFLTYAYLLLGVVFFIAAPIREELYPWYAVWLVTLAACLDGKKYETLRSFTIVLSFALELRQLPYIYMGYYAGVGPIARTLLTVVPLLIFGVYTLGKKTVRKSNHA